MMVIANKNSRYGTGDAFGYNKENELVPEPQPKKKELGDKNEEFQRDSYRTHRAKV